MGMLLHVILFFTCHPINQQHFHLFSCFDAMCVLLSPYDMPLTWLYAIHPHDNTRGLFLDAPEFDSTQNYRYFFPVPNIYDTDTDTFYGTKIFRYRFRDFFPVPNFTDTGSETFFRYHIFPIPREKLTIPVTHHKYLSPKFWQ